VLTSFESSTDYLDWVPGVHGLIISFEDFKGRVYYAHYLPGECLERIFLDIQRLVLPVTKKITLSLPAAFAGVFNPENARTSESSICPTTRNNPREYTLQIRTPDVVTENNWTKEHTVER
jgi:hypothetical protein